MEMTLAVRKTTTIGCIVALLSCLTAAAQTRVEFHLLPAVSTGPLDPSWSPDGQHIAFAMRGDIWTIPAAGGTATALTQGPWYQSEPAFSPDGSRIALTVDRDGNLDIGVVDVDGGEIELLTDHPEVDFAPEWSRDGESLYFVSRRAGNLDILKIDLRDKRIETIVDGPRNDYQPALSPDGSRLAYVAAVEGRNGSGGIWVRKLGDGETRLVHFEESSYRMKPRWSADGASITYISDAAGTNDVASVPAAGGDRARLTEDPGDEFDPALSPDGKLIAFVSNHDGPTRLYTLEAGGGPKSSWRAVDIRDRTARSPTGFIHGQVQDEAGNATAARLMLVASDGRSYTEDGGFHRMVPATRTHYQHVDGTFRVEVPAGPATIEAMRGFEHRPASTTVSVPAGGSVETELRLEAVTDPRATGWYSGDMHVHDLHEGRFGLKHEDFYLQLLADDVGVANALIHMDGTKIMGRWTDLTGAPSPLSNDRSILRYSQEFRGYFGHVGLVGVNRFWMPLIGGVRSTPFAPDTLALGHIDGARRDGAIAGFVHPYNQETDTPAQAGARDIPVLAALGKGDFYDVVSVASRERESAAIYYRLLNSGIRLAATGGTDNFSDVWYDPSGGAARTYARLLPGEEFNFDNWLAAVRDDRTFATSGPLLFLSVDGQEPGAEITLDDGASPTLETRVRVVSIAELDKVELLVNGEVARTWTPADSGPEWQFTTRLAVPESGWIAARVIGPASRYVGDAFAFAQTSPVYIVRDKQRFTSASDAAFLAEAVGELWRLAEQRDSWASDSQKSAYRDAVTRARDFYQRVILADPQASAVNRQAPEKFRVNMDTSKGRIVFELHRDWSPHGVDRFFNLVHSGYYDDSRFYRVRSGDFVQFGVHGDPAIAQVWREQRIPDDPVRESNLRGTVAFAMGHAANDRTTQVYINLRDKPELDEMGFAVMGRVVAGMDVADAIFSAYGEDAGGGIRGGKQDPIFQGGNAYLDRNFPELDRIIEAGIVPPDRAN
jgi:TolB protein